MGYGLSRGIGTIARPIGVALPLSLTRRLGEGSARLLTLEQRNSLKGSHPRKHSPANGPRYIAGIALPEPLKGAQTAKSTLYSQAVTAAIAEIHGNTVRIIEHVRWEHAQASLGKVLDKLGTEWRCQTVVVGGPISSTMVPCWRLQRGQQNALVGDGLTRFDLGRDLLEAMSQGKAQIYAEDGSQESSGFWSQMIRARRTGHGDDLKVYMEPRGDDGYLVSLALVIEAASLLVDTREARLCAAA